MPIWYQMSRNALLLLQSLCGVIIFAYPLARRKNFVMRMILGTALGVAICFVCQRLIYTREFTMQGTARRFAVMMTVYVLLFGLTWFCYEESVWTALFVASSGYIAQDVAGSVKQLAKGIKLISMWANHPVMIVVVDILCYGSIYLILYVLFRPFVRRRDENFDNKIKGLFSAVVLILCIGMARLTQDNPYRSEITISAESIYQILCDIMILILQFGVMEQARMEHSMDAMRELMHEQYVQYQTSKESVELVNEKYHDLKKMLREFRGHVPAEQLNELEQSLTQYDAKITTGNEVLDVLLTEKRIICMQQNIQLTCFVGGVDLSFVKEFDLYTLFGNALSNAIESVSVLSQGRERFITMTAKEKGGIVTIHMENPCEGGIEFEDGLPKSKRDARYHGFGMRSMERTAEQYGGSMTARQSGDMFYLDIILIREISS